MTDHRTSLDDCAEYLNDALGPIDTAYRNLSLMAATARRLDEDSESTQLLLRLEREIHAAQTEVARLRASLDAASEKLEASIRRPHWKYPG